MKIDKNALAEYFFRAIIEISDSNANPSDKISLLKKSFSEFVRNISADSPQLFSSSYSRLIYVFDNFSINKRLATKVKKAARAMSAVREIAPESVDDSMFAAIAAVAVEFAETALESAAPDELKSTVGSRDEPILAPQTAEDKEIIDLLKGSVTKKGDYFHGDEPKSDRADLYVETARYGEILLVLFGVWTNVWKQVWRDCPLNMINVKYSDEKKKAVCSTDSFIIVEPDYLVDATEAAECFSNAGINPYVRFIRLFSKGGISLPLVVGNIVNYIFDELLANPDADFDATVEKAFRISPMQIFALAKKTPEDSRAIKSVAERHFESLKKILPKLAFDQLSVEPSFISPAYGFQGRLDALFEYDAQTNRKDVVELKSGSAPATDFRIADDDGNFKPTGIWSNHLAQTSAYNLLLDDTFENRTGSSLILYSKPDGDNLRNAPNIAKYKRDVANLRNWIVALEHALAAGKHTLFEALDAEKIGKIPSFLEQEVINFANFYKNAGNLKKKYFHAFSSFIARELFFEKVGDEGSPADRGYSSLWNSSVAEKLERFAILPNLTVDREKSDFINMRLVFNIDERAATSIARKGDLVVLYPADADSRKSSRRLLKGSIREIDSGSATVSLRNKRLNAHIFNQYPKWNIEPDHIDVNVKRQYREIFSFLSGDADKIELIFGLRKPLFGAPPEINAPELNDNQRFLASRAVSAKDYFILQGPPGTGKTSFMLKNIVKFIFENTSENILALAFTNRAADEICSALINIDPEFPFLRLGSKGSTVHEDRLVAVVAEKTDVRDLYKRILKTRVFVSTISSAIKTEELYEIKSFQTAIIDEATQVVEPQIVGILSKVDRYILIGDEKQLPAIVSQPESQCKIADEDLNSIGINDLRRSLFERALWTAKTNSWEKAYGALERQGRMHVDAAKIANTLFYENALKPLSGDSWQNDPISPYFENSDSPLLSKLAQYRAIFFASSFEPRTKVNLGEAEFCARLVGEIFENFKRKNIEFTENSVGVISPFRAQCAEIRRRLPEETKSLVDVDTVERYQGSQRDVIIISLAVNYPPQLELISSKIEFGSLKVDRKLNVALTRARHNIAIIGNPSILQSDPIYLKTIEILNSGGAVANIDDFD